MNTLTPNKVVTFTRMDEGTEADYAFLDNLEQQYIDALPNRIMLALQNLEHSLAGYQISRLQHSLQSATRAENDGADIELIVGALIHDLGDELAPLNHAQLAASIIQPYVRCEVTWIVKMHGLFQMQFFGKQMNLPVDGHLEHQDHPWFESCQRFCDEWDQKAFDPSYPTHDLSYFEPMVREIFSRKAFDPDIVIN